MTALGVGIAGSVVLWVVSGSLAVALAGLLAVLSRSRQAVPRWAAEAAITLTRGVPTSLLVVTAGIAAVRLPPLRPLPVLFPGTPAEFQATAWLIVLALALGSAGHLAVIFRTAAATVGRQRL